jgi:hypothetical protein
MASTIDSKVKVENVYDLLEKAESKLNELEVIKSKLPKFVGTSQEQAFFGLSKAIITCQRHVSLLMGAVEANDPKYFR